MALISLDQLKEAGLALGAESMGKGADLTFVYNPDLAGGDYVSVDDIVVIDAADSRRLYKGLVKRITHNLEAETVSVQCEGIDQMIDGQTWESVVDFYNVEDPSCYSAKSDQTIGDFFAIEFVNQVAVWFNSIVLPGALASLKMPALTTVRKGFMTVVQEIVKKYPYLQWVIEYTQDNTIFPAGNLVFFDTRTGRTARSLSVGGSDPDVKNFTVSESVQDTASSIKVFARGHFIERYEYLQPDWEPEEELQRQELVEIAPPEDANGSIKLPDGHQFIRNLQLFVQNATRISPGTPAGLSGNYRLYPGADYTINVETGEIVFLSAEDGEEWWWVNEETGMVLSGLTGSQVTNARLRRPVACENNHIGPNTFYLALQYDKMGDRCYRRYTTEYPIADLRVVEAKNEDDEDIFKVFDDSVTIYAPRVSKERYLFEQDASKIPDGAGSYGSPSAADRTAWQDRIEGGRAALKSSVDVAIDEGKVNAIKLHLAHMQFPVSGLTPTEQQVRRWFVEADTGISFEEGTRCIELGKRQVVSVPAVYDRVWDSSTQANPAVYTDWATWPVLARYTSWHEVVEERTNVLGQGREVSAVANSILKYERSLGGIEPEVVIDTTDQLSAYADDLASFYGEVTWEGSMEVFVEWNAAQSRWEVPYRVGDRVTLSGEVSDALSSFSGIINSIDYSEMGNGTITLNFGRRTAISNPWSVPEQIAVDIEGDDLTGPDVAGLQTLGGN